MCRAKWENGGRRCKCTPLAGKDRSSFRKAASAATAAKDAGQTVHDKLLARPEVLPKEEEQELARAVAYATGQNGRPQSRSTLTDPNPHDVAHLEQQWQDYADTTNETARALLDKYGTLEQAATRLGESLAARGEAYAGITGEDVRIGMEARFKTIRAEFDENNQKLKDLRESASNELHEHLREHREERQAAEQAWVDGGYGEGETYQRYQAAGEAILRADKELRTTPGTLNYEYEEAYKAAVAARPVLQEGVDEQAKQELRALSDGYQKALRDVRDVGGGTYSWHERTQKKAQVAFNETAQVFPTDWVEYSEEHESGHPVAKVQASRAHYSPGHVEKIRKRVPVVRKRETYGPSAEEDLRHTYGNSPVYELKHVGNDDYGTGQWEVHEYEVHDLYSGENADPDRSPRGRGWALHAYTRHTGDERVVWRRPKTMMQTVDSVAVPEIKTSENAPVMAGRSTTFATATHEMSHRFEATVPDISEMERAFLDRRTINPDTGERDRVRIYARRQEFAYEGGFTNVYMGKTYKNTDGSENRTHYELLSTGSEALFAGRHGGLIGAGGDGTMHTADHDMRAFVLGVFATAGRKDAAPGSYGTRRARQDDYQQAASPR